MSLPEVGGWTNTPNDGAILLRKSAKLVGQDGFASGLTYRSGVDIRASSNEIPIELPPERMRHVEEFLKDGFVFEKKGLLRIAATPESTGVLGSAFKALRLLLQDRPENVRDALFADGVVLAWTHVLAQAEYKTFDEFKNWMLIFRARPEMCDITIIRTFLVPAFDAVPFELYDLLSDFIQRFEAFQDLEVIEKVFVPLTQTDNGARGMIEALRTLLTEHPQLAQKKVLMNEMQSLLALEPHYAKKNLGWLIWIAKTNPGLATEEHIGDLVALAREMVPDPEAPVLQHVNRILEQHSAFGRPDFVTKLLLPLSRLAGGTTLIFATARIARTFVRLDFDKGNRTDHVLSDPVVSANLFIPLAHDSPEGFTNAVDLMAPMLVDSDVRDVEEVQRKVIPANFPSEDRERMADSIRAVMEHRSHIATVNPYDFGNGLGSISRDLAQEEATWEKAGFQNGIVERTIRSAVKQAEAEARQAVILVIGAGGGLLVYDLMRLFPTAVFKFINKERISLSSKDFQRMYLRKNPTTDEARLARDAPEFVRQFARNAIYQDVNEGELGFADRSLDVVLVALQVFPYIKDKLHLFQEVKRVLVHNGVGLINDLQSRYIQFEGLTIEDAFARANSLTKTASYEFRRWADPYDITLDRSDYAGLKITNREPEAPFPALEPVQPPVPIERGQFQNLYRWPGLNGGKQSGRFITPQPSQGGDARRSA